MEFILSSVSKQSNENLLRLKLDKQ